MYKNIYYRYDNKVIFWLKSLLIFVFLMIIIGGVTRITDSGLSMVEWRLISGIIPPLSDLEWGRVFELYKSTPEYLYYNVDMNLAEFKYIFFWEYFHRLWGRIIGFMFLIPFVYFLIKRKFNFQILIRLLIILFFGVLQAFLGWWMVESGLHTNPDVSQYRLTIHLGNALVILFLIYWLLLDLINGKSKIKFNFNTFVFTLITLTIIAGAFVSGMDAGLMYNTYPLMNGNFTPDDYLSLGYLDPFENPGSAQFHHRHLGLISLLAIIVFYIKNYHNKKIFKFLNALLILILFQFILGIIILLNYVPNLYAGLHQVGAILIFLIFVKILHVKGVSD